MQTRLTETHESIWQNLFFRVRVGTGQISGSSGQILTLGLNWNVPVGTGQISLRGIWVKRLRIVRAETSPADPWFHTHRAEPQFRTTAITTQTVENGKSTSEKSSAQVPLLVPECTQIKVKSHFVVVQRMPNETQRRYQPRLKILGCFALLHAIRSSKAPKQSSLGRVDSPSERGFMPQNLSCFGHPNAQ
jgi:hypothetical protein